MSTEHQESTDPQALAASEPAARTARGPIRRMAGLAARHKVVSASVAVFVAAAITVSIVTKPSAPIVTKPSAPRGYPPAPAFTVAELGHPGAKISLSQFKGKPLVLNFWASWCEPCQQESPLLASWYKQQHGHVILIGLDENDSAAKAIAFAHAKGMAYSLGFDPLVNVAGKYGVVALPQTFFLNAQHRIVDHLLGAVTKADMANGLRLMNAS